MHGTWKVTGGGTATGVLGCAAAGAAFAGVQWVLAWLWLIIVVGVVSGVLATAGALWIGAWCDRRAVLATAQWPVQRLLRGEILEPVAPPRRAAAVGGVTINVINPAPGQYEEIVRQAIARGGEPGCSGG